MIKGLLLGFTSAFLCAAMSLGLVCELPNYIDAVHQHQASIAMAIESGR